MQLDLNLNTEQILTIVCLAIAGFVLKSIVGVTYRWLTTPAPDLPISDEVQRVLTLLNNHPNVWEINGAYNGSAQQAKANQVYVYTYSNNSASLYLSEHEISLNKTEMKRLRESVNQLVKFRGDTHVASKKLYGYGCLTALEKKASDLA